MLKNYFKIAIAVLKRRKFFTFISLFGISLTLTILIVLSAFIDLMISPVYPDINRGRELFINNMSASNKEENSVQSGSISFYMLENFVSKMKTPQTMSFFSNSGPVTAYQNNKKINSKLRYTDLNYWSIYQFEFLEGKAFNGYELKNADRVAVISSDTRASYFGEGQLASGKYITVNKDQYRVIGVVKDAPATSMNCDAGIYLPYTVRPEIAKEPTLFGNYNAVLLAASPSDLSAVQEEYKQLVRKLPHMHGDLVKFTSVARTYLDARNRELFWSFGDVSMNSTFLVLGIFIFLFMLLPTLNLVNINISRIMERSSEIGVRKAFGASGRTLVGQFIVENLILTLLGGIIGVVLSIVIVQLLNSSGMIPHLDLKINLKVLCWSVLASVVFGLMSGVYPAWRMSKMNVVKALKANN